MRNPRRGASVSSLMRRGRSVTLVLVALFTACMDGLRSAGPAYEGTGFGLQEPRRGPHPWLGAVAVVPRLRPVG